MTTDNGQRTIEVSRSILQEKSYAFALKVVRVCRMLQETKKEFVLTKQLLRSGTAIGALVEEGRQAESKPDFIHKLSISNKEANETQYWIRLLIDSEILDEGIGRELLENSNELIRILTASLKTSKANR